MTDSIKIRLIQNSKNAKQLADLQARIKKNGAIDLESATKHMSIELEKASTSRPLSKSFKEELIKTRSPIMATTLLEGISKNLRKRIPLPDDWANLLADALDQTLANNQGVTFLYGSLRKAGRPSKDLVEQFEIFFTIEKQYSKLHRLGESRNGQGAYEASVSLLLPEGIRIEVDGLRRIRREVLKNASQNLDYLFQLISFIETQGYRMKKSDHELLLLNAIFP